MKLTFKLSGKSYMVRVNHAGKNFTLQVTNWGYLIPTEVELSGSLRPASDFEKIGDTLEERVPRPLYEKVSALVEMLCADISTLPLTKMLNMYKIETVGGNSKYRVWVGDDKTRSVFFYLNKKFNYRTSSQELYQNRLLKINDWLKLKEQLAIAGKVEPAKVVDVKEKEKVLVIYLYLRKVMEIEEIAHKSYLERKARLTTNGQTQAIPKKLDPPKAMVKVPPATVKKLVPKVKPVAKKVAK